MAWDLGSNLDQEAERALITDAFGAGRAANLFPAYPLEDYAPIVGRGTVVDKKFDPTARRSSARPLPDPEALTQPAGARRSPDRGQPDEGRPGPAAPDRRGWRVRPAPTPGWCPGPARRAAGRCCPTTLTWPPRSRRSSPRSGCTAAPSRDACPYDVAGFSLAVGAGRGDRAQRLHRLGPDHQLSRCAGPLSRGGRRQPGPGRATRSSRCRRRPSRSRWRGRSSRGRITIRSSRHGPLLSDVSQQLQRVAATEAPPAGPATRWL